MSALPIDNVSVRTISFKAEDKFSLAGDLYCGPDPKLAVVVSAGTGFPKRFYSNVATYLASLGAVVLTFDYRGIGGSGVENLADCDIDYPDWGKDQTAAVEALISETDLPLVHLAHSVGGHFLGFISNHAKIRKHAFVSVGTGYFGGHHLRNIPLELYFWWGFGSFSLLRWGYIKKTGGWRGAALPPKVFRTWRRWSHKHDYFKGELNDKLQPHFFDEISSPIRSWIFPDDPIATRKSTADILSCYPNAPQSIVWRKPSELGVGRIGHEGAFRPGREKLWDEIWDWMNLPGSNQGNIDQKQVL